MNHLSILTFVAFQVNSAIDGQLRVSVKEMEEIVQKRKLFAFFDKHKEDFDMSIVRPDVRKYIEKNLSDISGAYQADKFGVENNGFCLLLALLLELIQRNAGKTDLTYDVSNE